MHLLYIDDSGSATNKHEDYFVLGGVSVVDSSVRWLTNEINKLAQSIDEREPNSVEFHAAEIFQGTKKHWKNLSDKPKRVEMIKKVLLTLQNAKPEVQVFAVAIHKASFPNENHVEFAYEELSDRFNSYLQRISTPQVIQRGMMIFDETAYALGIQQLSIKIRKDGNRWRNQLRNIIEIPLFVDSKTCRITQLADHIAYAVFRRYNANDINYYNCIENKFDCEGTLQHGLVHKYNQWQTCTCSACLSRRFAHEQEKSKGRKREEKEPQTS